MALHPWHHAPVQHTQQSRTLLVQLFMRMVQSLGLLPPWTFKEARHILYCLNAVQESLPLYHIAVEWALHTSVACLSRRLTWLSDISYEWHATHMSISVLAACLMPNTYSLDAGHKQPLSAEAASTGRCQTWHCAAIAAMVRVHSMMCRMLLLVVQCQV